MNKTLEISAMQYDFHTLLKVSDICGLTIEIDFHDLSVGHLVSLSVMMASLISGWFNIKNRLLISKTRFGIGRISHYPRTALHRHIFAIYFLAL